MSRNTAQDTIAEGYLSLLKRGSTDKINVSNIIKESNVSRQTFYYHFQDLDDLREYVIMRMIDQVIAEISVNVDLKTNMKALLDRINEDMPIIKSTYHGNGKEVNQRLFLKGMKKVIRLYLENSQLYKHQLSVQDVEIAATVYGHGIVGLVEEAVEQDTLIDSEIIADFLERVWTGKLPLTRTN